MNEINKFNGQYRFLSNFYYSQFNYEEKIYNTIEHAYQAAKTLDEKEKNIVRKQNSPARAKHAGRRIKIRSDWEEIKLSIMERLVRIKFNSNDELEKRLIETNSAILIEGNTWGDTFWGMCNGIGENHLGKILMKIREELKNAS